MLNDNTEYTISNCDVKVETCTITTKTFYVTLTDKGYEILNPSIEYEHYMRIGIYWDVETFTNYVIYLVGDWDIIVKTDEDDDFWEHISKLIGIDLTSFEEIGIPFRLSYNNSGLNLFDLDFSDG